MRRRREFFTFTDRGEMLLQVDGRRTLTVMYIHVYEFVEEEEILYCYCLKLVFVYHFKCMGGGLSQLCIIHACCQLLEEEETFIDIVGSECCCWCNTSLILLEVIAAVLAIYIVYVLAFLSLSQSVAATAGARDRKQPLLTPQQASDSVCLHRSSDYAGTFWLDGNLLHSYLL